MERVVREGAEGVIIHSQRINFKMGGCTVEAELSPTCLISQEHIG